MSDPGPGRSPSRLAVRVEGASFTVELEERPDGIHVRVDGQPVDVDARFPPCGPGSVLADGVSYLVDVHPGRDEAHVVVDGEAFRVQIENLLRRGPAAPAKPNDGGGGQRLVSPMPGKVVAVLVAVGQSVEPGAGLVVLEAMKMENEFRATSGGVVAEVHAVPGQAVDAGDLLVVIA